MTVDHELALERLDASLMEKHVCVECAVTPRLQRNTHVQLSTRGSKQHFRARGVLLVVQMLIVKSKHMGKHADNRGHGGFQHEPLFTKTKCGFSC